MKVGKHCIIGKDYNKECERKKCMTRELCRKEYQYEKESHHKDKQG